jgi:parallel beta-helix repeat protein
MQKMLTRRIIAGMVVLVCIVVPVRAATYYVATDGNDSNSGSEADPWKTIQKAADTMQAGDSVYIKEGTYVEKVRPKNSGSEGNWITYQAYPGDEVTIESPNSDPCNNYCVFLSESIALEYLHFKNLTLKGLGQWPTRVCFLAGGNLCGGEVKSHIILEGLTITNAAIGIYFSRGVTDSEIKDCNIYENGTGIYFIRGVWNTLISGNHVSYSHAGDGIVLAGWNTLHVPDNNMCSDITITNNLVHDVDRQGMLVTGSKNILVRGNHCHHNGATGIQIESDVNIPACENIVVEDNLCEYNSDQYASETGIWVDDSNDVLVQNNILRGNERGLETSGSFNVIVRNNIIYENNRSNNKVAAGILVEESHWRGCENNIMVHNTLYRNGGYDNGVFAQVLVGRSDSNLPADNAVFKNNISSNSLASYYCKYLDLWVYGQNPELNYNNYYQSMESLHVCWQSAARRADINSWSDYLRLSGQDTNSITSDPCFINIDNEDFHLHPDSRCIDAGAFLTTAKDTNSGTSLEVADSRYFTNGYGLIEGDLIKVGSNPLVRVVDVNYDTNTLSLDQSISWNAGDGVSYAYEGNAPDIGAYEYGPLVYNKNQDTSYESIQAAINEASSSDEIIVYPGTYYESVDFNGIACTLRSANSDDWDVVAATVIDGNGANNSVLFNSGEGSSSVLTGFTVTGAARCGVYCEGASPIVSKCIIRNNGTMGLYGSEGAPTITNNRIHNNDFYNIYLYANAAGLVIKNNLIYDAGGGIHIFFPQEAMTISNNTIVRNEHRGISRVGGTSPAITNCIVWDCNDDLQNCTATYSCIQDGDSGTGNIGSDPCFVDADNNDFRIGIHSPCVNGGDPGGNYDDQNDIGGDARVIGSYVDMGADEVNVPVSDAHQWGLDEKSGTTAYDSVGNSNGTFNGDDPCWMDGLIGGAVDFNGVNDYFSISSLDDAYDYGSVFTVTGWFDTNKSTGKQTIVGQWSQDGGNFYYGWQVLVENNKVVAKFGGDVAPLGVITGTSDVNDGEWHQFAMVRNGGNGIVLYVDGESEATAGTPYVYLYDTKFRIGDGSYVLSGNPALEGGPFNGMIDDVMIFNRVLSAEEVEQLYEDGL